MAFRMVCPKCNTTDFSIERDRRAYAHGTEAADLIFGCRCGKRMFGDQVVQEFERQKRLWQEDLAARKAEEATRLQREKERAEREDQLREALAFRARIREEKRREEEARRAEETRRWRERLGTPVEEPAAEPAPRGNAAPARSASRGQAASVPSVPRAAAPEPEVAVPVAPPTTLGAQATPAEAEDEAPEAVAAAPLAPPSDAEEPAVAQPTPAASLSAEGDDEADQDGDDDTEAEGEDSDVCAWAECSNLRRPNSKYCSRECSNKNARARHRKRKTPRGAKKGPDSAEAA